MGTIQEAILKAGIDYKEATHGEVKPAMGDRGNRRPPQHSGGTPLCRTQKEHTRSEREVKEPTAPYNFVSLARTVVPAPIAISPNSDRQEDYKSHILQYGKYTGTITLDIQTLTPCFIGGQNGAFFAPNGRPLLPGSSLRGMVKNIFKIITCGTMRGGEDIEDRHLYFRCIMAPKSNPASKPLHSYYKSRMVYMDENQEERKKTYPGFLVRKSDGKYYMCPAHCKSVEFKDMQMQQPSKAEIRWHDEDKSASIFTGLSKNKTSYRIIHGANWNLLLPINLQVIQDYKSDKNRNGIDLWGVYAKKTNKAYGFTGEKEIEMVVPCFYGKKDDTIQHFGHGRSYRIPYEKTISAHIPEGLRQDTIDFADAVFGKKELWASRVFFDDAELRTPPTFLRPGHPRPLASPKPTSFQLYLKQNKEKLLHWDDDTDLRGYKMYWHKNISDADWRFPLGGQALKNQQAITPLAERAIFHGGIRFQDLTEIELGALLQVFYLSDTGRDVCYKIGMGKPLGMGSIRVTAKLQLADEEKRYTTLFATQGWEEATTEASAEPFLKAFAQYMKQYLQKSAALLAYEKSMNELKTILDWNHTKISGWGNQVSYMEMKDNKMDKRYIDRAILPEVQMVVKKQIKGGKSE